MADFCMYKPMHGEYPSNCEGKECEECSYFYKDPVIKIMEEWRDDAGIASPILWKYGDNKREKLIIYTRRPGLMIGFKGERINRFHEKLKTAMPFNECIQNGIDFVEVNDGI